ncbi:hypothetical protein PSZ98_24415, partial [Shigella sonnei]|nr:hypothetical protein [Shigella sonnei]
VEVIQLPVELVFHLLFSTPLLRRAKQQVKYQLDWQLYDFDWGITYQSKSYNCQSSWYFTCCLARRCYAVL